jgi:hypothetical protein
MSDWGQGAKNNNIGWGQGAVNNDISWGSVHANSWSGDTNIVGFAYDADYQDILNRAVALGYTLPNDAQQIVQNQLVLDLKEGGVWSKLDVFYVFATGTGATNAFASLNWKSPTLYQGTLTNPLTFATNVGFTNNSTGSISTNFIPSSQGVNYQKDDASRFAWIQNVGIGFIDGIMSNGVNRMTFAGNPDTQNINNGTTSNAIGALSGVGLKSINRPANNQIRLFQNTTLSVSGTTTSTASSPAAQLIFRSSGGSTPTILNYGTHTISVYGMGASLVTAGGNATLNTNLYNAINTYMTNLV